MLWSSRVTSYHWGSMQYNREMRYHILQNWLIHWWTTMYDHGQLIERLPQFKYRVYGGSISHWKNRLEGGKMEFVTLSCPTPYHDGVVHKSWTSCFIGIYTAPLLLYLSALKLWRQGVLLDRHIVSSVKDTMTKILVSIFPWSSWVQHHHSTATTWEGWMHFLSQYRSKT